MTVIIFIVTSDIGDSRCQQFTQPPRTVTPPPPTAGNRNHESSHEIRFASNTLYYFVVLYVHHESDGRRETVQTHRVCDLGTVECSAPHAPEPFSSRIVLGFKLM